MFPNNTNNLNDIFDDTSNNTYDYVHIRIQQRNGKKSLTTIQGLDDQLDQKKILVALKEKFCCGGHLVEDKELGTVIQLQGDQRIKIQQFLIEEHICDKNMIKIHGF